QRAAKAGSEMFQHRRDSSSRLFARSRCGAIRECKSRAARDCPNDELRERLLQIAGDPRSRLSHRTLRMKADTCGRELRRVLQKAAADERNISRHRRLLANGKVCFQSNRQETRKER